MIIFPEGYFQNEVMNGFAVTSIMKACWAAALEVYHEVDKICERHDLTLYAMYGTLLGAVRHKGFIPWDDDIDLGMLRNDYMDLIKYAKDELPSGFVIDTPYDNAAYEGSFLKIGNGYGASFDSERLQRFHGFPFIVAIDVFPLDYVPSNKKEQKFQKEILTLIRQAAELYQIIEMNNKDVNLELILNRFDRKISEQKLSTFNYSAKEKVIELHNKLKRLNKITGFELKYGGSIKRQLALLFEQYSSMYSEEESDSIASFIMNFYDEYIWSKEDFKPIKVPFENIEITIPAGYDRILTQTYGDYMTPVQMTAGHDYPYFKKQLAEWIEYLEQENLK